ncbi:hypothetical protein ACFV23_37185, partial [Streptomyces sp. NPDC059627]
CPVATHSRSRAPRPAPWGGGGGAGAGRGGGGAPRPAAPRARGRYAGLVRGLWTSGIGAVRGTADRAGLRTGPVGPFVRRYRAWITWVLVAVAVLVYLLWPYPTGWVVVGIALCLLFVLAVVEFLLAAPPPPSGEQAPARAR